MLGTLHEANDWKMEADVDQQLWFPEAASTSAQWPDIIICSLKLRKLILIKLTCPAEENIEERHCEKIPHYESLVKDCISAGWPIYLFAIQVEVHMYAACLDHVHQA